MNYHVFPYYIKILHWIIYLNLSHYFKLMHLTASGGGQYFIVGRIRIFPGRGLHNLRRWKSIMRENADVTVV